MTPTWTYEEAEAYLVSRELYGWRFGLDRMHRLVSVLGMPQHRFASIHVVGTNGKSSVAEMAVALLEAHGVPAGAYISPHLERWSERVLLGSREIEPGPFAAAVERAAQAAEVVDRTLPEGEAVTQFEVCSAAAFLALVSARVEVGVIEAGLGGRLDATNVLPSRVTALSSVSLEHTELLGESELEIAAEKLDVLRPHSTLLFGEVSPEVAGAAERFAAARSARLVRVGEPDPSLPLPLPSGYARRNFALACAAVEALLGRLDGGALRRVAERLELPGRLELRQGDPPVVLDAAHNPGGARALAESLPELCSGRPVVACIAVLEGKDAAGMARGLAPAISEAVCTGIPANRLRGLGRPGARTLSAVALARACEEAGVPVLATIENPADAVERTKSRARELEAVALMTGTHYLLSYA